MAHEQTIVVDGSLDSLLARAQEERFGDWHVRFRGLEIYSNDLLALHRDLNRIFVDGIYAFPLMNQAPVIIDGGAHIGLYSLYAKKQHPDAKVIAFEPDENCLPLLMKNLMVNGCKDVQVVPAAIATQEGKHPFCSQPGGAGALGQAAQASMVRLARLAPYLENGVDVLKLHVADAAWDILKDCKALLEKVRNVAVASHQISKGRQVLHNVLALLDAAGMQYDVQSPPSQVAWQAAPPALIVRAEHKAEAQAPWQGVGDITRTTPISRKFGLDFGTSICRYYIEKFLTDRAPFITGRVLEIAENTYTTRYGRGVTKSDILHVQPAANATIIGDLATGRNIPENAFDCIILTQTLQCIFDHEAVLANCHKALKPGGSVLLTTTGLGQISRYDMDRWGEYWRFTDKCLHDLLAKYFPSEQLLMQTYGNVAAAKAYLDGLPAEEMPVEVLDVRDQDYQVLVTAVATKAKREKDVSRDVAGGQGAAQQLPPRVLMYHRVATDPLDAQLLCVTPENFDAQMHFLAQNRRVVPLHQLIAEAGQGQFIPGSVAVTFDDGYADNLENALPVLERYGIHATVFVCTGSLGRKDGFWGDRVESVFLGGSSLPETFESTVLGISWPTRKYKERLTAHDAFRGALRKATPETIERAVAELLEWGGVSEEQSLHRPVLDTDGLRRLAASEMIEIGAHGISHASFAAMPPEVQVLELKEGMRRLESILGQGVRLLAYPYGSADSFGPETRQLAKQAGYEAVVAVTQSDLNAPVDLQAFPRRVVRNWNGAVFAGWMGESSPKAQEKAVIAGREKRLLAAQESAVRRRKAADQESPLRVVHINTHDIAGGAAKSTWRMAELQRSLGHRVDTLVRHKSSQSPNVHAFDPEPDPHLTPVCRQNGLLFYGFQGSHRLIDHHLIKRADVVHMQNLHGGYFNPYSVALLSNFRPVVWTLRDMQSFTGHCAHAFDCERWRTGCGECPDLSIEPALPVDSTARLWQAKQDIYTHSRLVIVCPSKWLQEKVEQSVLGNQQVEYICNSVDTSVFQPHEKTEARRFFGLPENALLVGAAAHGGNLANQWKGGRYTLQALQALWESHPDMYYVNIGAGEPESGDARIINIPPIVDETAMARLYSALDLYLYTPLADTCPLVVIEALSCGLPVVSFATGGVPELVRQGEDGFATPMKDVRALVRAAQALLNQAALRQRFSRAAREGALARFRIEDMVARYDAVYRQAIVSFSAGAGTAGQGFDPARLPTEIATPVFLQAMEQLWNTPLYKEA